MLSRCLIWVFDFSVFGCQILFLSFVYIDSVFPNSLAHESPFTADSLWESLIPLLRSFLAMMELLSWYSRFCLQSPRLRWRKIPIWYWWCVWEDETLKTLSAEDLLTKVRHLRVFQSSLPLNSLNLKWSFKVETCFSGNIEFSCKSIQFVYTDF